MSDNALVIRNLNKSYDKVQVLKNINLEVKKGQFFTLLGPSGCGKSTILRLLTGIEKITDGDIILNDTIINDLAPEHRDISMVFQSYALFPHMNVLKNLSYGLRMKKIPPEESQKRIDYAVAITNLKEYLYRSPKQLSGGQQQRVALARAIVMQPALLLLDEPLSNLDAKLRDSLRADLVALHKSTNSTSIYVTHDQSEAMAMSDLVAVMNFGEIIEIGTPEQLYRKPRFKYTATFLGNTNVLDVKLDKANNKLVLPWGDAVDNDVNLEHDSSVSIRPEDIDLVKDENGNGRVLSSAFLGANCNYIVLIGAHEINVNVAGNQEILKVGQSVHLTFKSTLHPLLEN